MAARLRIFVSSAPNLEAEREIIGQAIAGLPVSLGWVINYTPWGGKPLDPALRAVAACDFYVFLLGEDVKAPVGVELRVARQAGKAILPFVKEGPRTPAARVFIKDAAVGWQLYRHEDELRPLLQRALIERILEGAEGYGISPVDWETLSALLEELSRHEPLNREMVETGYRGAGKDAVIVAPGRHLPEDGVLIEKSKGSK